MHREVRGDVLISSEARKLLTGAWFDDQEKNLTPALQIQGPSLPFDKLRVNSGTTGFRGEGKGVKDFSLPRKYKVPHFVRNDGLLRGGKGIQDFSLRSKCPCHPE